MITQNFIQQVKSRIELVEVVAKYVRLTPHFKGLCPFHTEKTPSFSIHKEKQIWKCFGCGKGGDVFAFLQLIEHINFPTAVARLAQQAGITLSKSIRFQKYLERKWQAKAVELGRLKTGKFYLKQAYLNLRNELLQLRRSLPAKLRWDSWNARDYLADQLIELRFDSLDEKMKAIFTDFEREEERIRHG